MKLVGPVLAAITDHAWSNLARTIFAWQVFVIIHVDKSVSPLGFIQVGITVIANLMANLSNEDGEVSKTHFFDLDSVREQLRRG